MYTKKLDAEEKLFIGTIIYTLIITIGLPLGLCWGAYKIVELIVNSFK